MAPQVVDLQVSEAGRRTFGRTVVSISTALALVPYAAIALLYLFAWDTSRRFGAWPTPATPDPKDASNFLYTLAGIGLLASLPAVFGVIIGLPIARRFHLQRLDIFVMLFALFGCLALAVVFSGNLGTWYAD